MFCTYLGGQRPLLTVLLSLSCCPLSCCIEISKIDSTSNILSVALISGWNDCFIFQLNSASFSGSYALCIMRFALSYQHCRGMFKLERENPTINFFENGIKTQRYFPYILLSKCNLNSKLSYQQYHCFLKIVNLVWKNVFIKSN